MSVCLPKHYVCSTYLPDFIAGPSPCVLQATAERRSRLTVGGTFFRSLDFGVGENTITVACEWQKETFLGSGIWVQTSDPQQVQRVALTLTKGVTVETYYADQEQTFAPNPPPNELTSSWQWTTNAIPSLRSQLSSSAIATMPSTDGISGWNSSLDDQDHIGEFGTTNFAGGSPPAPSSSIRTGPIFTILHFTSTENSGGVAVETSYIRYWNSENWVIFNPLADCYDPNNLPEGTCT